MTERADALAEIVEAADVRKAALRKAGHAASDTAPLNRMRRAVKNLQKELRDLAARVGICQSQLEQVRLRQSTGTGGGRRGAGVGGGSGAGFEIEGSDDDED